MKAPALFSASDATARSSLFNTVMAKKKKNHSYLPKDREDAAAEAKKRKEAAFKRNRKYIWPLILNTVAFYGIYAVLNNTPACTVVMWLYFALLIGFAAAYVIYNQGFFRNNLTPEQLPSSMSDEEKQAFIDEGKRRSEKSKWMITIIFPLVMTFIIDIVILFMPEPLIEMLGI